MKQLLRILFLAIAVLTICFCLNLNRLASSPLCLLTDSTNSDEDAYRSIASEQNGTRKANDLINALIRAYCWGGESARPNVDEILNELAQITPEKGELWQNIMDFWDYSNSSMEIIDDVLPDGLNDTDSLCIVAMGYALTHDGSIRAELGGRLETVLRSAQKYPNAYILCTGGYSAYGNRSVSEASQMAEWLIAHGIAPERIITEKSSMTTVDNVRFTYQLLEKDYPNITDIAVISSDYHVRQSYILFYTQFLMGDHPLNLVSHAAYPTQVRNSSAKQMQMDGIIVIAHLLRNL